MDTREIGEIVESIKYVGPRSGVPDLTWAQQAACEYIGVDIKNGYRKLYVNKPTGTGKGGIFLSILETLHNEGRLPRALIMTPTRLLADDLVTEARKFAPSLAKSGALGRYTISDGRRQNHIMISTYASGVQALESGLIPTKDLMLVEDEGHLALSDLRRKVFSNPDLLQMAYTASPAYYKTKSLDTAGYRPSFVLSREEAVKTGLICGVRNIVLEIEDPAFSLDDVKLNAKGDYDDADLDRILQDERLSTTVADFYTRWINPETGKTLNGASYIAFCNSIKHAQQFSEGFNRRIDDGMPREIMPCAPVWGAQPRAQKDWVLEGHKKGYVKGAACADYLIHGYNNPGIEIVFNMRPTRSAVIADQRAGRALRLDPSNPDKMALIVDVVYPGRKQPQLLFSDIAGGVLFRAQSSSAEKSSVHISGAPEFHPELKVKVIYTAEELLAWRKIRDAEAVTGRFLSAASLPVRRAMMAKGLTTQAAFEAAVAGWLFQRGYDEDRHRRRGLSISSVVKIVKREEDPVNENGNMYKPAAAVLAGILGKLPGELFGGLNAPLPGMTANGFNRADDFSLDYKFVESEADQIERQDNESLLQRMHEDELTDPDVMEQYIHGIEIKAAVKEGLKRLSPRMEKALCMRFAIGAERGYSLCEIGDGLFVTQERVRQILLKAGRRLSRNPHLRSVLTGHLDVTMQSEKAVAASTEWIMHLLTLPEAKLGSRRTDLLRQLETALMTPNGDFEAGLKRAGIDKQDYLDMKFPHIKKELREIYMKFQQTFAAVEAGIKRLRHSTFYYPDTEKRVLIRVEEFKAYCEVIGIIATLPRIMQSLEEGQPDQLWSMRKTTFSDRPMPKIA